MTEREMVEEFYAHFGEDPDLRQRIQTRLDLLQEEADEAAAAAYGFGVANRTPRSQRPKDLDPWEKKREKTLLALAKELQDLKYVIYGLEMALGIESSVAFAEVHRSNMSKLGENGGPILRSDGKILKGPNYREPDMRGALDLE